MNETFVMFSQMRQKLLQRNLSPLKKSFISFKNFCLHERESHRTKKSLSIRRSFAGDYKRKQKRKKEKRLQEKKNRQGEEREENFLVSREQKKSNFGHNNFIFIKQTQKVTTLNEKFITEGKKFK
jgi:hypothetical protein